MYDSLCDELKKCSRSPTGTLIFTKCAWSLKTEFDRLEWWFNTICKSNILKAIYGSVGLLQMLHLKFTCFLLIEGPTLQLLLIHIDTGAY